MPIDMAATNSLSQSRLLDVVLEAQRLLEQRMMRISHAVDGVALSIASVRKHFGEEIHFMLKNKLGLTKNQAQKLFYDYKNKGKDENPENGPKEQQPGQPEDQGNVEQKISMIMNYMQETSTKLDQIEKDISYLKEQVDRILEKI